MCAMAFGGSPDGIEALHSSDQTVWTLRRMDLEHLKNFDMYVYFLHRLRTAGAVVYAVLKSMFFSIRCLPSS